MRSLFAIACALMLSQAAFAQHYRATSVQHNSSTFEIGTQLFNFDYEEVWTPPARSNESGFIPGLSLAYTYRGYQVPIYARASFEYTKSQTDYEGDLFLAGGGMIPITQKTNNRFTRIEVQGGYTFSIGRRISITPYTGYAHRAWTRLLSGTGGYEENYSWSYVPVGVRGDLQIGGTLTLGLDAAMRLMFGGALDVQLYDNPTLDLGSKLGFRLSLPSSLKLSPHWAIGFEPWLEFSGIDQSPNHYLDAARQQYIYEPESSTSMFGTNVTVQYGF